MTVRFGQTTSTASANRVSRAFAALFSTEWAIIIAITSVFPEPVAIFTHHRAYASVRGMSTPTRWSAGASTRKISVSAASRWAKNGRSPGSRSSSNHRPSRSLVTAVAPGYPASRHDRTRSRKSLTSGSCTSSPVTASSPSALGGKNPLSRRPATLSGGPLSLKAQ